MVLEDQRTVVEAVSWRARDRHRDAHGLRERNLIQQGRKCRIIGVCVRFPRDPRSIDDQDEFAFAAVIVFREPGSGVSKPAAMNAFEALGDLPGDDKHSLIAESRRESSDHGGNAMRRLVEHQRARIIAQTLQRFGPRRRRRRKEAAEHPLRRADARCRQRGDERARPRNGHDGVTRFRDSTHKLGARIADRGRSGIGNQRHALACGEPGDDLARASSLVVLVQGNERCADAVMRRQQSGNARVLGGDDVDLTQHIECAKRDVAQVSDRRRHHI